MVLFRKVWILTTILLGFTAPLSSQAKLFSNSYMSFEMPPSWDCKLDGTEYICVSQYAKQSKEAIIILTAKEAGPTDNLQAYLNHLKTPRSLLDSGGKVVPSKVLSVKERTIGNHAWVDGMHMGSEIPSYYTRYLATIKDRVAILITFSAHKEHYTKYSRDFMAAVESLRITAAKDMLSPRASTTPGGTPSGVIGNPIGEPLDVGSNGELPPEPAKRDLRTDLLALALLIGAIGFYLWRKKKR